MFTSPPDSSVNMHSSHVLEDLIQQTNTHRHVIDASMVNLPQTISVEINGIYLSINSLKLVKHLIANNIIDATVEEALKIEKCINK